MPKTMRMIDWLMLIHLKKSQQKKAHIFGFQVVSVVKEAV